MLRWRDACALALLLAVAGLLQGCDAERGIAFQATRTPSARSETSPDARWVSLRVAPELRLSGGHEGSVLASAAAELADAVAASGLDVRLLPLEGPGSVFGLDAMLRGEVDVAVVYGGDAYLAYFGLPDFDHDEDPTDEVRALGPLFAAPSLVVVRADAQVQTLRDLAGGRIAVGPAGSGSDAAFERFARQLGLLGEILPVLVGGTTALDFLQRGRVDAYHVLGLAPSGSLEEALLAGSVRVLATFDEADTSGLLRRFPAYRRHVLADGTAVWGDDVIVVVRAGLAPGIVRELTEALYGGPRPVSGASAERPLEGILIPLHAGAAEYWRSVGAEVGALQVPTP
jgi:uncharacterized protein